MRSVPPLICVILASSSAILSSTAISTHYQPVTSFTTIILTGSCTIAHIIDPASFTRYNVITFTIMNSSYTAYMTPSSNTTSVIFSLHIDDNEGLILVSCSTQYSNVWFRRYILGVLMTTVE